MATRLIPTITRLPTSNRRHTRTPRTWLRRGGLSTLIFALPLILGFALYGWYPIIRGLVLSFQKTNLITFSWVGFDNFAKVFANPVLGQATLNTLYFALLAIVVGFPAPIIFATLISQMRRTKRLASILVFLPTIIPPVVALLLWKEFYRPSSDGIINQIIGVFGLGPVGWLQNPATAMPALVLESIWAGLGTSVIIYLAAMVMIPRELYEAAEVDGASIWKRVWHVTLPQLRGTILLLMLLAIIGALQVFTEPYVLTDGGPENKTTTILLMIYRLAFLQGQWGQATALSLLLAIALAILSAIYLRATRKWSQS